MRKTNATLFAECTTCNYIMLLYYVLLRYSVSPSISKVFIWNVFVCCVVSGFMRPLKTLWPHLSILKWHLFDAWNRLKLRSIFISCNWITLPSTLNQCIDQRCNRIVWVWMCRKMERKRHDEVIINTRANKQYACNEINILYHAMIKLKRWKKMRTHSLFPFIHQGWNSKQIIFSKGVLHFVKSVL